MLGLLLALMSDSASAPPLADPPGITNVVQVQSVTQLIGAISNLTSNTKIVILPGTYTLLQTLTVGSGGNVNNVIIRGSTGNRADVRIRGAGMGNTNIPHGFSFWNATNVILADLSVGEVGYHPIDIQGQYGAESIRVYNCRVYDGGEQLLKSNPGGVGVGCDNGRVEYCVFEYTTTAPSDYTNGVDVHRGANWIIRHSLFRNIRAPAGQGLAGPAILMWRQCSNTLVEGNSFFNCERGIALGFENNGSDHTGGIVRNNIFYRSAAHSGDVGIQVCSPNARVLNNTVICSGTYGTPIEYRFTWVQGVVIMNNLIDGSIWARDGAGGTVSNNLTNATPAYFVDAAGEDLHLAAGSPAIDQATVHPDVTDDWDGQARSQPDIGADEYGASSPAPAPPPSEDGSGESSSPGGSGACGLLGLEVLLLLLLRRRA